VGQSTSSRTKTSRENLIMEGAHSYEEKEREKHAKLPKDLEVVRITSFFHRVILLTKRRPAERGPPQ